MSDITPDDLQGAWEFLYEKDKESRKPKLPHEKSVKDLQHDLNVSEGTARRRANQWLEEGRVTRRQAKTRYGYVWYYSLVEKEDPSSE